MSEFERLKKNVLSLHTDETSNQCKHFFLKLTEQLSWKIKVLTTVIKHRACSILRTADHQNKQLQDSKGVTKVIQ